MEKFRGDFQTLYQMKEPHPHGMPLETHVDPSKVNDEIPLEAEAEAEVEAALRRLRSNRAGIHTHVRAEHFRQLQGGRTPGRSQRPPHRWSTGSVW